jgi:hypothetical protein
VNILKSQLGEDQIKEVEICKVGERLGISFSANSLKFVELVSSPGLFLLQTTQGILEIKKLVDKGKSKETASEEASNN